MCGRVGEKAGGKTGVSGGSLKPPPYCNGNEAHKQHSGL